MPIFSFLSKRLWFPFSLSVSFCGRNKRRGYIRVLHSISLAIVSLEFPTTLSYCCFLASKEDFHGCLSLASGFADPASFSRDSFSQPGLSFLSREDQLEKTKSLSLVVWCLLRLSWSLLLIFSYGSSSSSLCSLRHLHSLLIHDTFNACRSIYSKNHLPYISLFSLRLLLFFSCLELFPYLSIFVYRISGSCRRRK